MTTAARDNGGLIIVVDEDLMVQLADMLEKLKMVEAKLARLGRQRPISSATSVDAGSAKGRADGTQSTARELATKAVIVARDAVLFCERLEHTRSGLKPRRVPTQILQ
jgi:hypothetical protein